MGNNWSALKNLVFRAVDNQWGDTARIIPWKADDNMQDYSRSVQTVTGVMSFLPDAIKPFGGPTASAQFLARVVELDITFRFSPSVLPWELKQSDRLHLLDKNQYFEIDRISPDQADRVTLHLLELP